MPPLSVGEERSISSSGIRKRLLRAGQGWATPLPPDEVSGFPPPLLSSHYSYTHNTSICSPLRSILIWTWFCSALRWVAPRRHAVCVDEGMRAPHDQSWQW